MSRKKDLITRLMEYTKPSPGPVSSFFLDKDIEAQRRLRSFCLLRHSPVFTPPEVSWVPLNAFTTLFICYQLIVHLLYTRQGAGDKERNLECSLQKSTGFLVGLVMAIMVVEEKDEENLGLLRKTWLLPPLSPICTV